MDRARDGPLHPDGSELNSYRSQRGWRCRVLDIVTGESHSDATDADASVLANDPHIHKLPW
jgi:hypothetical protein